MDFLVALDVLLGLSLVYLVFSLAVTSINEFIAALLSSRAKWLRKGIASLLSADSRRLALDKADAVLDSPFLAYLGTPGVAKTFRASYVSAWTLMQGVLSQVEGFKAEAFAQVREIRALAEKLDAQSPIRNVLVDLCARAGDDLAAFQTLLDGWFRLFESQVSAWYRQKTQYVVVALSAVVAVGMNIDTIAMARQLTSDPELRRELVLQAQSAAEAESVDALLQTGARDAARQAYAAAADTLTALESAQAGCDEAAGTCPAASALDDARADAAARRAELEAQQQRLDQRRKEHLDAVTASGLQVGWNAGQFETAIASWSTALEKLAGLLLSAFALALGAPFWFNMLKSVAAVRSVGVSPVERREGAR